MSGFGSGSMHLAYPRSLIAPLLAVGGMAGLWGATGAFHPWIGALLLIAGLGSWTLVEYLVHRFMLHGPGPFQRWHLEHHRRPELPLRIPLAFSLLLLCALVLLPGLLIGDAARGAAFSCGLILGHLLQETVHHRLHLPMPQSEGWLAARWRDHWRHHHDDGTLAFGTLTGLWDRLFGTDRPQAG